MNSAEIEPDRLLTSSEVGELLQVTASSVKKWVNDGRLPAFRTPGGHRRIRAADLVAFLGEHRMPVPRPLAGAGKKRLLVVDDDATQLRALGRALKRHADRVEVQVTASGIEALVRVGAWRPHLVLLDVYMPGLDGIEVCRRLRLMPETAATWVVITSGHLTGALERSALEAGARRCLRKPIELAAVLAELGIDAQKEL